MQPLFTVHAGEFLVADYIERTFKNVRLWIPTRDTGVDLLVTDVPAKRSISLQVKYSRDYLVTHLPAAHQSKLRACGWWTVDLDKVRGSKADYWIFLLVGFDNRTRDFVIVPPAELARRLASIHVTGPRVQSYLWITRDKRCWETRGIAKTKHGDVVNGTYTDDARDFTSYLNNWKPLDRLNGR